jgi:lipopolysaccharide export system protein LptC
MPNFKTLLTYLLLALLALATWWGAELLTPKEESKPKPTVGKVDYYSRDIRRTVMDAAGHPKELLLAESLTHYENDNHTELRQPVLTLYDSNGGSPWIIHAESALLPGDGETIYLQGEVLVEREAAPGVRPIRIETREARVQPDNNYAETDEALRVVSEGETLDGVGGQVWFGDNLKFNILADVRRVSIPAATPAKDKAPAKRRETSNSHFGKLCFSIG